MSGKRIGFVDYKLDNFHANIYLKHIRTELVERGYIVAGCTALDAEGGVAWAAKNQVTWYPSVAAMDAQVDVYCILAPSTPELHLVLCQSVLPCGKPTYVDKTFAPDLATAKLLFAMADRGGTAMQTTSALRYTNVQIACKDMGGMAALRHMVTWGGGRSFGEYAIHPTELAVSCLGPEAVRLTRRGAGDEAQLLVDFSGGRTLVANVYCGTDTAFAASLTTAKETRLITADMSHLFLDMATGLLDFYDAGTPAIDRRESLAIRAILDAAENPAALTGWVPIVQV